MRYLYLTLLLAASTVGWASPTVTVTLSSISGASTWSGVYAYPYTLTVGTAPNTTTLLAMCDDYVDHMSVGQSWQAYAYTLSSSNVANFMFYSEFANSSNGYDAAVALQAYNQAGYILTGIGAGLIDPGVGNAAVWKLFYPSLAVGGDVTALLSQASSAVTIYSNYSNVTVYTPVNLGPGRPQEFLALNGPVPDLGVPEPPASWLFAAGGGILAALAVTRRKRAHSA